MLLKNQKKNIQKTSAGHFWYCFFFCCFSFFCVDKKHRKI